MLFPANFLHVGLVACPAGFLAALCIETCFSWCETSARPATGWVPHQSQVVNFPVVNDICRPDLIVVAIQLLTIDNLVCKLILDQARLIKLG